jgi:hypothetical protein
MKYLFECDQPNCYRRLTFNSLEEVEHERVNHKCPYWGGESKVSWSVTKTLVQQMWDMLDETMVHLMEDRGAPEAWKREEKARARAFAECLAIFMRPFFDDADDIAREAARRYRAKKDGDTEYETPGIGMRRYETAALAHASRAEGWYGTPEDGYTDNPARAGAVSTRRAGRGSTAPAPIKIRMSEQDQSSIKKAHAAMPQIFTVATLAKQYGATEAEVAAILKA